MQKALDGKKVIATLVVGELMKNSNLEVVLKKLSFIQSDELVKEAYEECKVFLSKHQFENNEMKFFAAYRYINELVTNVGEVSSSVQDLLEDYRLERVGCYIFACILKRINGTNDILAMSIADQFLDILDKLPKFYRDMADIILNQSEIDQIKILDRILTAVKVEQPEALRQCGEMGINAIHGMVFDGNAQTNQSIKDGINSEFRDFITSLQPQTRGNLRE